MSVRSFNLKEGSLSLFTTSERERVQRELDQRLNGVALRVVARLARERKNGEKSPDEKWSRRGAIMRSVATSAGSIQSHKNHNSIFSNFQAEDAILGQ